MTLKKTLSFLLSLALVLSVLAPCGMLQASAAEPLYGSENLIQVTEPVIGESYYLGADVGGTMMYFRHGAVTDTVPYSLVVTDNIDHNWCFKLTVEDPTVTSEKYTEGFQLTYTNPTNSTLSRIYCIDMLKDATVAGQTGVMDTGIQSGTAYKNRHNFFVGDLDGLKVIRSTYKQDHVLVVKEIPQTVDGETANAWRMLFVPESDLANEGVHPAMLLTEHAHTYGNAVIDSDNNAAVRTCTGCGHELSVFSQALEQVANPVIGQSYYLSANVNGQLLSFISGGVTETSPYSLKTSETLVSVTLQTALQAGQGEFQLVDGSGRYLYSIDAGVGLTTSTNYITFPEKVSFSMDIVNGQSVIRAYGTNLILAAKYSETKSAWRIFGVDESEIGTAGVHPVTLSVAHEHTLGNNWIANADGTTSQLCTVCGFENIFYGGDIRVSKVEEPLIGQSYYLGANVAGTMMYFRHGTVGDSVPYSLVVTDNFNHNWTSKVTLEDPTATSEKYTEGFQFTYINPKDNVLSRIYCMDALKDATVAGQTGVMDTGVNTTIPYMNRHNFFMHTDGTIRSTYKNDHVLVIKQVPQTVNEVTTNVWRMLFVADSELANTGVYPVMLLDEHAHTYGAPVIDSTAKTAKRTCNVCGYEQVINGYKLERVERPVINQVYYLSANVNGQLLSFISGGVTETTPYSLKTSQELAAVTVKTALVAGQGEFQLDAAGSLIYSVDAGVGLTKSSGYVTYPEKVSFFMDKVNGEPVIRAYGTNLILAAKYSDAKSAWRIFAVEESEIGTAGVYPVTLSASHAHTEQWVANADGTTTLSCTVCGFEEIYYGGDTKVSQVEDPAIGGTYYLAANVDGVIKFFTTGTVTNTAPYSLVTTERPAVAVPVTLEDPNAAKESTGVGFQITFDNNGTVTRIYCMDVLKDATTAGQTGVMDTGTNSSEPYRGRHTFECVEIGGVKVLRKLANNNILVVKYNETTKTYRMLGVTEAEFTAGGVYPVMLANLHEHSFGDTYYGDANGHWTLCDCGSKSATEDHVVDSWTVVTHPTATEPGSKTGTCTVCGETVTVETPVIVDSWNIVPGDDIGVNFVLALTQGDTVQVQVDGEEVPVTLADNKNGTYNALIHVAAAQMTAEIAIVVNGQAVEKTYSVREYADLILADAQYTDYAKTLIKNMLSYGAAAQIFFNYNVENLANAGITVDAIAVPELMSLETSDNLDGIDFYGATVVMENKTAVRFYFNAQSVDGLTFSVDGNVYEPAVKDGMYYVEVAGIEPQNYADLLNLLVTDGTNELAVAYSPLHYITRMYRNGSDETKAVAQAMYGYYMAAKSYYANLNLDGTFTMTSQSSKSLYEGVDQLKKTYVAAGYGEVEAYIVTVAHDANVELKVSAGAWDESNNAENPAETKTVVNHFRAVKNAGFNVLAMINGGFFDLNTTGSMLPLGMQVVDGVVNQEPDANNPRYADNWFGMTNDGKYVISNAAGYASTYTGNVKQAIGGGRLLMVDGVVQDISSERDFRTAVGITSEGDLVMVCVEDATYNDVCQIFVDMNMDIVTVLNLDGGGSTTMCIPGAYYPKTLIQGDDGLFAREVADAVAIVVK